MGQSFAKIAFTPLVKKQQALHGSRTQYERIEQAGKDDGALTRGERDFILSRDTFYMATTSETGWPYIQHRGGPRGFLHVLDDHTLAFADLRGNKQYVSAGNLQHDDRVALFLIDYPSQTRLKILGHAILREGKEAADLIEQLRPTEEKSPIERAIVITVEAFDWNCPQHITPRYTEEQIAKLMEPIRHRLDSLEQENKRLRTELAAIAKS